MQSATSQPASSKPTASKNAASKPAASGPAASKSAASKSAATRAAARRRFVPPQHGAWAMLAVPYLAGVLVAGWRWPDAPLAGAWLAGYLASYFAFQAVKSRRPGRYRPQLLLYGAVAAPLALLVVLARPAVLWYAPVYAVLVAVNAWYAWRRRERALLNDIASVVQSCVVALVVGTVAGKPLDATLDVFLLCLAYFGGTVLYVKTMIRERNSRAYRLWSVGYHAGALALAAWLSPWAGVLFAALLARAALLPGRGWTPKRVGLIEIGSCVALLAVCVTLPG